jgi:exodeoxyribonuclease V alpha subunit
MGACSVVMKLQDRLQGFFAHVIYRDDKSAYTVVRFRLLDRSEKLITVTGYFASIHKDILFELIGEFTEHPRFGVQFQVHQYHRTLPNEQSSLIKFLSSPLFPGIGKRFAENILHHFQNDTLTVLKTDVMRLQEVPGYSEKKLEVIMSTLQKYGEDEQAFSFFTMHGLSVRNIQRLEAIYGKDAYALVKENPYRLVYEVDGIGFKTADKLAKAMGYEWDNPLRLQAAMVSLVGELSMRTGDSYILYDELIDQFERQFQDEFIDSNDVLSQCIKQKLLILHLDQVYHPSQHQAEAYIAHWLSQFPFSQLEPRSVELIDMHLNDIQNLLTIQYDYEQINAIHHFFTESFMILTGGPGTGKSTVIGAMIALWKRLYPSHSLACVAPTGRAARRLFELNGVQSFTIHSLLKWDLESNHFGMNESNPLQLDCLIVDEFSMVDTHLFATLLKASHQVKKLILVGDHNQLPSVAPGQVLNDLRSLKYFKLVDLHHIYRQKEGSDVINLAHQMHNGWVDFTQYHNDIKWIRSKSVEIRSYLLQEVQQLVEQGFEIQDIQVLAPMYSGYAGIDALNHSIQKFINPPDPRKRELRHGPMVFREYDKILQLKNSPTDDVYNGDIGRLVEIVYAHEDAHKTDRIIVDFDGRIVEYNSESFNRITLAYCISVHKSQGSEYPIVLLPIVPEHQFMLDRRLLYTAISRASKRLILFGQDELFQNAITIEEHKTRRTGLIDKFIRNDVS